ncbi:MAG: hypothetical protein EON54_22630 [Alcaligenaceae bacterium]|nr:MAG: hypothetical protein EON54_22630 [Alcaligenaceae bacterium]
MMCWTTHFTCGRTAIVQPNCQDDVRRVHRTRQAGESGSMELERTFAPITIRKTVIPNRVAMAAHETRFANGPTISDALVAYHAERAKGGVGLIILEAATVHPSSTVSNNPACLAAYDDQIIEGYQRLMEAVRPYGTRIFQQLWHGGHHFGPGNGQPPRGVSSITSPILGVPPVPLELDSNSSTTSHSAAVTGHITNCAIRSLLLISAIS